MFEVVLKDADVFRNAVPIIADIIDEGVFKISNKGISLISPDRSMVSVVELQIPPTALEKLEVTGEEDVGVRMADMVSVVKRIKSGSRVTLRSGENRLQIVVERKNGGKRRFDIPLIEVSVEKPPIEELTFKSKAEVSSDILQEGIEDAEIVDDSLVLEITNESFRIEAKSETSASELEVKKGEEGLKSLNPGDGARSRYPIDYLKKMIKARSLAETVTVEFSSDYPLRLTFLEKDKVMMRFILAPRVEE